MRSAIYVQGATERQARAHTIAPQIERLRFSLQRPGQALHAEPIFRDEGSRGAPLTRPGLDRRRDQHRDGGIERVLIARPDRLARHDGPHMVLLEECERAGCQVVFLEQPSSQAPSITYSCANARRGGRI